MKFREIFHFELMYQARRAWPWLIIVVLMFLVFLFVRDGSIAEAMYTEFFINSPFMVAMATVFGGLLWLMMGAFVAGEAASRDTAANMYPIVYTTPITKTQYLGGKFLAAFTLNAFMLLMVQVAILLAIYLPGVHPTSIGPFRPAAFITAYSYIALPNAFIATVLQFVFALRSGRPIVAYMASLLLFFVSFFISALITFKKGPGLLLDSIGIQFIWSNLSHLWTTIEKSQRLLTLTGTLLQNRLIWIGTGLAVGLLTYIRFHFAHHISEASLWSKIFHRKKSISVIDADRYQDLSDSGLSILNLASAKRKFGFSFHLRQMASIAWASFKMISGSGAGLGLLIFIPLLAIPVVLDQMAALGYPLTPTTARVVKELTGPLSAAMSRWMVVPGFIIYFAGELVWRERDNRVNEITDTMPGSEWAPVIGKFAGLCLTLILFTACLIASGMAAQLVSGYDNFEIGLYLKMMFGLQLPEYILFAALALFVHAAINQKYVGHLIAIIAYAFIAALATMVGIEHNLLIYGAGPGWSYTEMRGFGSSIEPWLWFKLYWAAWALLLIVGAVLLWTRGKENTFGVRIRLARLRFTQHTAWVAIIAILSTVSLGGYIFYNTNIINQYRSSSEIGKPRAGYEQLYGSYENIRQPKITGTKLHIEIYPERRAVEIKGSYQLTNSSTMAIDSIHVSTAIGATNKAITFDQEATLVIDDDLHHYRIYSLKNALQPGDTMQMNFEVTVGSHGFGNHGIDPSIEEGSSFFNNQNWFPFIGYQQTRGLINPSERKEHGLAPRPVIAALSEAHDGEPVSIGGGILFDVVIGTSANQVAVTAGILRKSWNENGRHYFHYSSSAPIGTEWYFFSANYEVYEKVYTPSNDTLKPVTVQIYHAPQHTAHLENMMHAALSALKYYGEQFGAYPYSHLTIVEHPAAPGTGMHAEASMIYYGQGYPHWIPKNENRLNLPYAVMGHEMGHQWGLPYAYVEGLPFLSEGLAWHYGIMLVKDTRGPKQTRMLMSFMRQPYPYEPIRHGEPLMRAVDPYLAYKRGPLAMYALSEYVGSDRVNRAIRTLNKKSEAPNASPVTTLDLYRELKTVTPDTLQTMLHDFFEVNTLWNFEVTKATAVKNSADTWEVTISFKAKKIVYDSAGVETEIPFNYEWIPVGVYDANREPGYDRLSTPLYLKKHRIRSGEQTIKVIVSHQPVLAGIDPQHLLDWEEKEDDDNIEEVTIKNEESPTQK